MIYFSTNPESLIILYSRYLNNKLIHKNVLITFFSDNIITFELGPSRDTVAYITKMTVRGNLQFLYYSELYVFVFHKISPIMISYSIYIWLSSNHIENFLLPSNHHQWNGSCFAFSWPLICLSRFSPKLILSDK